MKFNNVARITAALLFSLTVCLGFTACSRDYTVGFLYVLNTTGASATDPNGTISEYGIDYQTGALLALPANFQSTQGRNPVGLVISPNQKNVYVINHDDSNIESLLIGTDGKLYPQKVTSLDGIFPTGISISSDGGYLYVTFTYRKTTATANSGPGGVEVYKLVPRTDGSGGIDIGAAVTNAGAPYFPVGVAPVQVAVGPNVSTDGTRTVNPTTLRDHASVLRELCVRYRPGSVDVGKPAGVQPQRGHGCADAGDRCDGGRNPSDGLPVGCDGELRCRGTARCVRVRVGQRIKPDHRIHGGRRRCADGNDERTLPNRFAASEHDHRSSRQLFVRGQPE